MNPESQSYRILVVDDTPSIHDDFRKILAPALPSSPAGTRIAALAGEIFGQTSRTVSSPVAGHFAVDSAMQGEEALALVQDAIAKGRPYALAFVDMRIPPGWDGLETIRHLWRADPELQIVICTAYSDHSWAAISEHIERSDNLLILKKPFDQIEVLQLAHALCHKWQLARDNENNLRNLDLLVAQRTSQLSKSEERFTKAFEASPLAQAIVDLKENRFLNVNSAFEKQYAISDDSLVLIAPQAIFPSWSEAEWHDFANRLRNGQPSDEIPVLYTDDQGRERHVRCSARAVPLAEYDGAILVMRDVTEQIETERQLRQSQKLEVIGQLSAGIAHDFNNLLTVIQCYTEELLASQPDPAARQMIEPVQAASSRASALVRQLLIFSRRDPVRPILLDFANMTSNLQPFIRRLIGTNIDIEWLVPKDLPPIEADPANIEQIVVNLVVNARDAMPAGGRITISAEQCQIDKIREPIPPDARPGRYIAVTVADTGTGIAPEILPHIFEPFFTTKEAGKGTGLGLSTVSSLARRHGGWIQVESKVGHGTSFTVFHPVAEPKPTTEADIAAAIPTSPSWPPFDRPPHRILAVDDDRAIQYMLSKLFARHRIDHVIAPDGLAALSMWNATTTPFNILITDYMMPNGVNGIQLARALRMKNPRLAVVVMSGYCEVLSQPEAFDIPGGPPKFLDKPFTFDSLRLAIEDALKAVG